MREILFIDYSSHNLNSKDFENLKEKETLRVSKTQINNTFNIDNMAAADMRAMFESHGMAALCATALVTQQGIDNAETLADLSNEDVDGIGQCLRKPGGTIQRGGSRVSNPGILLPYIAEKKLKLIAGCANTCEMSLEH